jgi:hypothetical protein
MLAARHVCREEAASPRSLARATRPCSSAEATGQTFLFATPCLDGRTRSLTLRAQASGRAGAEHARARHASLADLHERPTPNYSEKHAVAQSGRAASCMPGPEGPGSRALACEGARLRIPGGVLVHAVRLEWYNMRSTCLQVLCRNIHR